MRPHRAHGLIAGIALAAALAAGPAGAQRAPERIVNYRNQPVAGGGGAPVQREKVKQAILEAARARDWTVAYEPDGKILATRSWRQHSITVEIPYSATRYSLIYRDSVNMNYHLGAVRDVRMRDPNKGFGSERPLIHPYYNRYVKELRDGIHAELLRP